MREHPDRDGRDHAGDPAGDPDGDAERGADGDPIDDGAATHEGAGLVNAGFAGTGALLVAAIAGVVAPDDLGVVTAVVSGVLFVIGTLAFLYGYATGVVRSRDEQVHLGGLFFLAGSAPRVVAFRLRLVLLAQVVLAVVAAVVRPYTAVAFAILAPMFGLGLLATWGARHGRFEPKIEREGRG